MPSGVQNLKWPTNAGGYHVQYTTNLLSPGVWQRFSGDVATNAGNSRFNRKLVASSL